MQESVGTWVLPMPPSQRPRKSPKFWGGQSCPPTPARPGATHPGPANLILDEIVSGCDKGAVGALVFLH